MSIEKRDVRQWPMSDVIRFTVADAEAGAVALAELQGGEVVTGGSITVLTAWNTTGAATVSLGDGDTDDRYADEVDLKATGRTALTLTGHVYAVADELLATFAFADEDADAGEAVVEFTVVREGRQNETA